MNKKDLEKANKLTIIILGVLATIVLLGMASVPVVLIMIIWDIMNIFYIKIFLTLMVFAACSLLIILSVYYED